jgi:hypothetical protein
MRAVLLSCVVAIGMAIAVPSTNPTLSASSGEKTGAMIVALQEPSPAPAPSPQPDLNVDLDIQRTETVWYTDPVWLALGGLGLLIVMMLIAFAVRGGGGGTTIVKD